MRRRHRMTAASGLLLTCSLLSLPVLAQQVDKSSRERELLRRTQLELQKLQQDNAALARDKAKAETDLKAASSAAAASETDLRGARRRGGELEAEVSRLRASEQSLNERLQDSANKLAEASKLQGETARKLAAREAELAQANAAIERGKSEQQACETHNAQLYEYGQTLLERYRDKGVWSALMQREPVLGLHQVEIENTVQDYRDKLSAQKLKQP